MDPQDLISRFAVALGIGLLIGLERGWRRREGSAGSRAAGIRTFALSSLLGAVTAALASAGGGAQGIGGGMVLAIGFAVHAAVITLFSRDENRSLGVFSATTSIAGMLTFALGAYAVLGDLRIAVATAVAGAVLLAAREELHGWVEKITWPELRSGLVLLTMTFVGLPILPDEPVGPFGGVNPREVWLVAIVLAGVSFLGYAAVKHLGARRGLLLAAAAGSLASSTAVTITNARHAAAAQGSSRLLAAGVAIASAVMFLRIGAIVAALQPSMLVLVAPALLAATLAALGFAFGWMARPAAEVDDRIGAEFRNPFDFWSVVGFALFLAVIMVLGRTLGEAFGSTGAVLGAIAVGAVDVDAITVSMARLAPETLSAAHASLAILAAAASGTVSKAAIGAAIGRGWFAIDLAALALGCLLIGGAVAWWTLGQAA